MARALIFGVSGQDGFFLSELLRIKNIEVVGVSRSGGEIVGCVSDYGFVEAIIKHHQPDYIFHLAANSTTRHDALFENHQTISTGTLNILESARLHCPGAKVFLSGSAMQFKNDGLPIDENSQFEASSPYSVARIQSVYAGRYYRSAFGLQVYAGYFFNHDSPHRSEKHVNQKIVGAVQRIAAGSQEKLELGNIDVRKEFSYAGDVVEAVWLLVNQDQIYEAIIGSGKAYSIREWTEYCFKKINKNSEDFLLIKEGFVPEYQILVSNPMMIRNIGWQPKVDIYQLADMMMEAV
jgi:GDPmannose 4,6-dehydratase